MKRFLFFVFLLPALLAIRPARADVLLGVRGCNNNWHQDWILVPAPEIALSSRFLFLSVDGTYALFTPSDPKIHYTIRTRNSILPGLRLPFGPFFLSAGYGLALRFQRDEKLSPSGRFSFDSATSVHGAFRAGFGTGFSLSRSLSLVLKGEYDFVDRNDRGFAFAAGILLKRKVLPVAIVPEPDQEVREPEKPAPQEPVEVRIRIRSVTFPETSDEIVNELNRALGIALIKAGIQMISWDKMKAAAGLPAPSQPDEFETDSESGFVETTDWEIVSRASETLKCDGFIRTKVRYVYQSYGGDILINSAQLVLIDTRTGSVMWASEYQEQESSFSRCKERLSEELVRALAK
ncbi:hypothetical protein JW906_02455 [bacterium]|nr:hypothetical protein [bacterium]